MLRKIIPGLTVALVTGLAALAYSNPRAYQITALCVALLATLASLLFSTWSMGAESRTDYSKPNTKSPMLNAVNALGIWLGLIVYLALLYLLSYILKGAR